MNENVTGVLRSCLESDVDGAVTLVAKHGGITMSIVLPESVLREEINTGVLSAAQSLSSKLITLSRAMEDMAKSLVSTTWTI